MLDTLRQVETPEGLALNLRCAGMVPRALAWLLDFMIRVVAVSAVSMVLAMLGGAGVGIALIVMFLIYWGYPIAFEVLNDGQTIGKRTFAIKVVNDNGTPITWVPSIVRNLMRTVDMMPFCYGFGLVSGLLDPAARRLGDHAAGTLVVYAEKSAARVAAPPSPAIPAPVLLLPEEQRAIVAFAERSVQMTVERQTELADLLAPVTGMHGGAAVRKLLGIANYLLGRR